MSLIKKFFKPLLPKNVILDSAKEVLDSLSDVVFNSAIDVYKHIYSLQNKDEISYEIENVERMINVRNFIKAIINYNGNIDDFSLPEKEKYLSLIKDGSVYYDDMIRVLVEHHDDVKEANYLFEAHPELHNFIPKQYDNPRQVIEVLIEYIRDYQWKLEAFLKEFFGEVDDSSSAS